MNNKILLLIFIRKNNSNNLVHQQQSCILEKIFMRNLISLVSRVFANGLEDLGSIPGRIIQNTLKWFLMPPRLTFSDIRYVSRVKWSNPGKGIVPSPTPRCSSYWKGSLLVALYDYGRQLYFTFNIYLFLTFSVFRQLSSSLFLYSQRFGWCVLRSSSGVSCRTQKPTRNFEPNPLFILRG